MYFIDSINLPGSWTCYYKKKKTYSYLRAFKQVASLLMSHANDILSMMRNVKAVRSQRNMHFVTQVYVILSVLHVSIRFLWLLNDSSSSSWVTVSAS